MIFFAKLFQLGGNETGPYDEKDGWKNIDLLNDIVDPSEHKDKELLRVSGNVQRSQVVPQSFHLYFLLLIYNVKRMSKAVLSLKRKTQNYDDDLVTSSFQWCWRKYENGCSTASTTGGNGCKMLIRWDRLLEVQQAAQECVVNGQWGPWKHTVVDSKQHYDYPPHLDI